MTAGTQYTFNQDDGSNNGHPLGLSMNADGTHGHGVEYQSGVVYSLDGVTKTWLTYKAGFNAATQRRLDFTPTVGKQLYYYCASHSGMGASAFVNPSSGVYAIDGVAQRALTLRHGHTYNFNLDDASLDSDPLSLSITPAGQVPYTTVTYTITTQTNTTKAGGLLDSYFALSRDGAYLVSMNGAVSPPANTALSMMAGNTYVFDLSHSSNILHPLYLSQYPDGDSRSLTTFTVTYNLGKYEIDGVPRATLNLLKGYTYKFDLNQGLMAFHPFGISATVDGPAHTAGITYEINGVYGYTRQQFETAYPSSTSRSVILIAEDTTTLHYCRIPTQISNHYNLGGQLNVGTSGGTKHDTNVMYKLDGVIKTEVSPTHPEAPRTL